MNRRNTASAGLAPRCGGRFKCLHPDCNSVRPMSQAAAKRHHKAHDEARQRPRRKAVALGAAKKELAIAYPGICNFVDCPNRNCGYPMGKLAVGTTPKCSRCGEYFKVEARPDERNASWMNQTWRDSLR